MARFTPSDELPAMRCGQPLIVPVLVGEGQPTPGASVQLYDVPAGQPAAGPRVVLSVAVPTGSLSLLLDLAHLAALEDQLRAAGDQLADRLEGRNRA